MIGLENAAAVVDIGQCMPFQGADDAFRKPEATPRLTGPTIAGWVERSEAHRAGRGILVGLACGSTPPYSSPLNDPAAVF